MIYKNLFIGFVIACVVMLANEINCQQQRPQQTPQQLLQQMQQQIQQRPQQQRPQQRPQQQRPQQQRPRPQQPQQQRPRPQPQQLPSQQQPQQQQQCSPRAGSCQQNSDCCSTSCLLQRCQRSVAEIQQEIALGYSGTNIPFWDTPGSKRYNNLDDLLGSIYEEDGTNTRDNIRTTGANRPAGNNIQPGFNNNRPAAVSDPNDIRLLNNNRLGSNRNLPVSNSLGSRFGGNDSTDQQTSGQCAEIGTRCTRGLECCSTRCHGFLHKCVV